MAIGEYLKSSDGASADGPAAALRRHALACIVLTEAMRGLKDAPAVGLAYPCGSPWPFRIARKDGVIFVLFEDPDGEGEFLVPFDEAEIVDLGTPPGPGWDGPPVC